MYTVVNDILKLCMYTSCTAVTSGRGSKERISKRQERMVINEHLSHWRKVLARSREYNKENAC